MTITITLPAEVEKKLQERAAQSGQDVTEYVHQLIEKDVQKGPSGPSGTLDEMLAPIRRQFEESGMTEKELDTLIEETREEVWQEKRGRKA